MGTGPEPASTNTAKQATSVQAFVFRESSVSAFFVRHP
jgi:hypothetical protein